MSGAVGAYGLRIEGIADDLHAQLGPAEPSWPSVDLRGGVSDSSDDRAVVSESEARVGLPGGGEIVVRRNPMAAEVLLPTRPSNDELLHPYLGYVSAIAARWLERDCIHAGAFVVDEQAWGLIGAREAGKSSTLGWLAAQGYRVVCDDMLVFDQHDHVFAGPRFIDLRREAADILGDGKPVGSVGSRRRWRLPVAAVPPRLPFAGWVILGWAPTVEIRRARVARRLAVIKAQLSLFTSPRDAASLLDLAAFPAWELTRPQGWKSMADAAGRLLEVLRR